MNLNNRTGLGEEITIIAMKIYAGIRGIFKPFKAVAYILRDQKGRYGIFGATPPTVDRIMIKDELKYSMERATPPPILIL